MGSNGPSQNVVSTLQMHIDHVKTGTAKIFQPPPPLSLWNTPEALYL
jgi:hypothetical protein